MLETVFIGVSLGSVLLLIALGLAITYGAMGVINMAHGELVMVGAYTTVLGIRHLGLSYFLCLPLAFLVTALLGLAIERSILSRLYGRLPDTLLATWGVSMILIQLVRLSFGLAFFGVVVDGLGPGLQNVPLPAILSSTVDLGGVFVLQPFRSFILSVTLALLLLTWWVIYRTSFGTQLRAVTRNRAMAACCGIDVGRVDALTFAFGSGLAGVAGVLVAGFKTVSPEMGTPFVVDAFLVVVMGGVSSLLGTVGSSVILGQVNVLVATEFNDILARAVVFLTVILIILWRPNGLFAAKGRR